MIAGSRNHNAIFVKDSPKRFLHDSWIFIGVSGLPQDLKMTEKFAVNRVNGHWRNLAAEAFQQDAPDNTVEKEIKEKLQTSEDDYIAATGTLYSAYENAK